jgi:hypothetical protein
MEKISLALILEAAIFYLMTTYRGGIGHLSLRLILMSCMGALITVTLLMWRDGITDRLNLVNTLLLVIIVFLGIYHLLKARSH